MEVIEPSPIIPSDEIGKTTFSNVSEFINFIFLGSIYSIKNTLSFSISLDGSVIKIISPNFNNNSPSESGSSTWIFVVIGSSFDKFLKSVISKLTENVLLFSSVNFPSFKREFKLFKLNFSLVIINFPLNNHLSILIELSTSFQTV